MKRKELEKEKSLFFFNLFDNFANIQRLRLFRKRKLIN